MHIIWSHFHSLFLADPVPPTRSGGGAVRGAVNSNIILALPVTNVAPNSAGRGAVNSNIKAYYLVTFS